MIGTAKAIYAFLTTFGLPAYSENTVPDGAELPYIIFPLKEPEWDKPVTFPVRVYYRAQNSNYASLSKADEIAAAVGSGITLPCEGGCLALYTDHPLIQELPPENDIRGAMINLQLNAYHMPGV